MTLSEALDVLDGMTQERGHRITATEHKAVSLVLGRLRPKPAPPPEPVGPLDYAVNVLRQTKGPLAKHGGGPLHNFWDDGNYESLPDAEWIREDGKRFPRSVVRACLWVEEAMRDLNYDERCHVFSVFHNGDCDDEECGVCKS